MFSRTFIVSIIGAICCVLLGMYVQKLLLTRSGNDTTELQNLVQTIGVFMELPDGETPTLATVTDTEKLPALVFFSHAKTGDKVLIYQKAAKAILYRPTTKKIIDTSVFRPSAIEKEPLTVELRNGTQKSGLTADFEKKLARVAPELRVVAKETAKRRDYTDSMVIVGSTSHRAIAASLAKEMDIAEGQLPQSEASLSADLTIIIGADALEK